MTVKSLTSSRKGLTGLLAADKGYIDKKLTQRLADKDLNLITKVRKNMKKKALTAFEKFFLYQRSIIETVIGQLKSICMIEHSRHRNPINFLVNLISGLGAYSLKPQKPKINIEECLQEHLIHN